MDDDVREALIEAIREGRRNKINARVEWANDDTDTSPYPNRQEDEYIADAILATQFRPRASVTDAEVDAAYAVLRGIAPREWARRALEAAREAK